MQFLIVGFSEQAQSALELLISREFTQHDYLGIPRKLSSYLYPVFPQILEEDIANADVYIVDLDGVGMMNFSEEHKNQLLALLGQKPAILISRQIQQDWQEHVSQWTSAHIEYVLQPYNRDNIVTSLKRILGEHIVVEESNQTATSAQPTLSVPSNPVLEQEKLSGQVAIARRTLFTQKLLDQRWSSFNEHPILQHLIKTFSQSLPFRLKISQHEMLVFPEKNMILLQKIQSVIDYFILSKNFKLSTSQIESETVYIDDFLAVEQEFLQQGCKPYQLSMFLWQIYQEVLPERLDFNSENLSLKLNYIPDFSNMINVPAYMRAISSACLNQPQHFEQLKLIFNFITKDNIHRVFLLAVLCNYADISSFEAYIRQYQPNVREPLPFELPVVEDEVEDEKNQQVMKARKQGFFARLLDKLSW